VAIAYLTSVGAGSSDNSTVATGAIDTTGATLLIAAVTAQYGPGTVVDSKGNTWHQLTTKTDYYSLALYWCVPSSVGAGHTFSASGGNYPSLWVAAFSGTHATAPFDAESGATPGSGTAASPGSITPSLDGCLLVSALEFSPDNTAAVNSGFAAVSEVPRTATCLSLAGAYLIQGTAAAVNPAWSWTNWVGAPIAVMAAFKPADATPPLVAGTAEFLESNFNGGSPYIEVQASAPTGGEGAGPTYQWERNDNGGSYSDLSGATSLTLTDSTAVTGHIYGYRCKQTRGVETVTTNAVTGQVFSPPARWVPRPRRGRGRGR
jgi:hypothetical protein